MSTTYVAPSGSIQVKDYIAGCRVTLVFKDEDNPAVMKNVTNLIMSAYYDRKKRMAGHSDDAGDLIN